MLKIEGSTCVVELNRAIMNAQIDSISLHFLFQANPGAIHVTLLVI